MSNSSTSLACNACGKRAVCPSKRWQNSSCLTSATSQSRSLISSSVNLAALPISSIGFSDCAGNLAAGASCYLTFTKPFAHILTGFISCSLDRTRLTLLSLGCLFMFPLFLA